MSYLRLIKVMVRKSFQQEMAFRENFWINLLNTFLITVTSIGGIYVVFSQIQKLNGWDYSQALSLVGVYLFITGLNSLVIEPSLGSLGGMDAELWFGQFDYTLLKPVPKQFYISIRNWHLWALVDLIIGLTVIVFALVQLNIHYKFWDIMAFFYALLFAMSIMYSFLLLVNSGAFWFQGAPLVWIYNSIIQAGRFPVGIYPGWLKFILTWIIPIGFIVTVPAQALVKRYSVLELLEGTIIAIGLLLLSSGFFKMSIKRYSSASS